MNTVKNKNFNHIKTLIVSKGFFATPCPRKDKRMVSNAVKDALLGEAARKAERRPIAYCGMARSWEECITVENGTAILWFNVEKDTLTVMMPLI